MSNTGAAERRKICEIVSVGIGTQITYLSSVDTSPIPILGPDSRHRKNHHRSESAKKLFHW